jgi:hypothetical protein
LISIGFGIEIGFGNVIFKGLFESVVRIIF